MSENRTLLVVLDGEYDEDELEAQMGAIRMVQGVHDCAVATDVTMVAQQAAEIRVRNRMADLLQAATLEILNSPLDGSLDEA